MIKKLLSNVLKERDEAKRSGLRRKLMLHEAKVGGTLFGEVSNNRRREFFCLDKHTWVWHEEWTDKNGEHNVVTTRYEVRPSGVLKSQNGSHYIKVEQSEAQRLLQAAALYQDLIKKEVYSYAFAA